MHGLPRRDVLSVRQCARVLLFSNPDVTWNGYPAGVSYEMDPANSAEAARSLNNTAATVAAFKGGSTSSRPPRLRLRQALPRRALRITRSA